jgi:hypothetical protein
MEKLIVPLIGREFLELPQVVYFRLNDLHHLAKVSILKHIDNSILFQIPALEPNSKVENFESLMDLDKFPSKTSFFQPSTINCEMPTVIDALQMADLTRIPKRGLGLRGPRITIELKPKQGFAQHHVNVNVPYCNNCIFQIEKCNSQQFEHMYDYCPLDLFSGQEQRMRRAINALLRNPHGTDTYLLIL